MRLACASAGGKPADVAFNLESVLNSVARARQSGAQLLLLPQLCLTGIGCGDLFKSDTLLQAVAAAAWEVAAAAQGMTCVFGLPVRVGEQVVSVAAVAQDGMLIALVPHPASGVTSGLVHLPGLTLPLSQDALQIDGLSLAVRFPQQAGELPEADIVAVPGGEPFHAGAGEERMYQLAGHMGLVVYANASVRESTTDYVYDGQMFMLRDGWILGQVQPFSEDTLLVCDSDGTTQKPQLLPERDARYPYAPVPCPARDMWCREVLHAAAQGLATRMANIGVKSLTLGVSGGLDSAHALLVSLQALDIMGLPRDNLHAVSLPAFGSTQRTQNNAVRLMEGLGLVPRVIPIGDSVTRHLADIGHDGHTPDAAYENAQARERTQVLMDLANMVNGLMVGPSDMSELALGFTTYGGDHMSMYAVNSGLYKSVIRMSVDAWARAHPGTQAAQVLLDILDTPVSPELLPPKDGRMAQKTEDIVGPYELNDFFLHHFLRDFATPPQLMARAGQAFAGQYTKPVIAGWMKMFFRRFFASQFKRSCMPDGPQVLGVSLSPRGGLSMPSDAASRLWLDACNNMMNTL
ncbi:MAG: NAD(+) synthase [Christensenellales bacterium]